MGNVIKSPAAKSVNQYHPGNTPVDGLLNKVVHLYKDIAEDDVVKRIRAE
jgi:hypothetical protein